ncbi:crAss001_48 related protein [Pectinatus frisingensis]|uniref:crAss001_48 related protein n=1 Tax=Pectinatus frisingensis TaxID=865 RepID=UPI0018C6987C|nr:hypothetical protein [Pectinatus frisingensis]
MELKDTIKMMNSADYQERYKAEYYQVKVRADKLQAMLKKYKEGTLPFTPSCSYELLYEQLVYMTNYLGILKARAEIENVTL